jgi:multidrug efflux pump subunit AcrA (membrane-fusion protein)
MRDEPRVPSGGEALKEERNFSPKRRGFAFAREKKRRRTARLICFGACGILAFLIAIGAWEQAERRGQALTFLASEQNRVPTVRTETVTAVEAPQALDLPATLQAFDSATLYARATGYISKREVDIGSRVRAGDLLATIAAPDLDQQLEQARAQLAQTQAAITQARATLQQANANRDLANVTNQRYSQLATRGFAAQQDADNARLTLAARIADFANAEAAVNVADANVKAQSANVSRLEQLTNFERVTAPFDGVITTRQVDTGDLVTADAASGTPLFSIARVNVLRVQVYVPQQGVFGLKDGDAAQITVPEMPGRIFRGVVARHAGALQAGTRTLLTEVDIDNADEVLRPGLYGIVRLSIARPAPVFVLPSNAVVFDRNGLSAGVYDEGVVHLRHLELAEDNGAQVVVRSGLKPGDRVVINPPVDLVDGLRVAATDTDQKTAANAEEIAAHGSAWGK